VGGTAESMTTASPANESRRGSRITHPRPRGQTAFRTAPKSRSQGLGAYRPCGPALTGGAVVSWIWMVRGKGNETKEGERLRVRLVRKCRWRWERDAEVAY
jgi:hypothetical protein